MKRLVDHRRVGGPAEATGEAREAQIHLQQGVRAPAAGGAAGRVAASLTSSHPELRYLHDRAPQLSQSGGCSDVGE